MGDTTDITVEQASRPNKDAAVSPVRGAGRILGVVCIIFLVACAWLVSVLPLSTDVQVALGFGFGLVLFVPGAWLSLSQLTPGKSLLSGGMAFLFLSTVALFEGSGSNPQLPAFLSHLQAGTVLCLLLLALFGILAHSASSPAAGLLTCLFALYLARDLLPLLSPLARVTALALGSAALLAWMFLWGATRADRLFPAMACLFIYITVTLLGSGAAREDNKAFALAVITLLSVYALCSIFLMRRSVRIHRGLTGFALVNGAAFAAAVWRLTTETGAGTVWLAPLVLLAVGAAATVALRSHDTLIGLSGLYLCQALLAVAALLLAYLPSGPALLLAAGLGAVPAVFGRRNAGWAYRATEYGFILAALTASFVLELPSRPMLLGPIPVSTHWFYLFGTAGIFAVLGRMHYHWSCREELHGTSQTAQRLLSLTQFFAAALLIMVHTILRRNDSESLPLLLSLQGLCFLGTGMLLLMPGLAVIGLVPVMAGHVCYHARAFLVPNVLATTGQGDMWQLWILLAVTLLLALLCDWQLGKRGPGNPLPTERILAMLPYLPLLAPLPAAMAGNAPPIYLAAVLGCIAVVSLAAARLAHLRRPRPAETPAFPVNRLPGLWTLGYACALASLCVCIYGMFFTTKAAFAHGGYLPAFWGYLVLLILFERLSVQANGRAAWTCRLLCAGIMLLAIAGVYPWNPGPVFAVALAGLALMFAVTGYAFRARAYYPAALLLLLAAGTWMLLSLTGLVSAVPGG